MSNSDISDELRECILSMARRDDVNSISCQFHDYKLWEGLLTEQFRRVQSSGKPPKHAFFLCGPDSGIHGVAKHHSGLEDMPSNAWFNGDTLEEKIGGEIHIPYEGVCGADLFVYPSWRRINPAAWKQEGAQLDWATSMKKCNHLLINQDLGDCSCATRISPAVGWWLYSSTAPYKDCNPLHDNH